MKEKVLINSYPSSSWQTATPLGNGRLGASVYGSIFDERILLNHEGLYSGGVYKDIPDVSYALNEVRKLMDKKEYLKAENYYKDVLMSKNYFSNKGSFFPAFDFRMSFGVTCPFKNYERTLNLENGVCNIKYQDGEDIVSRECFVSFTDKFVVLHLEKTSKFDAVFTLENHNIDDMVDYNGNYMNFIDKFEAVSKDRYVFAYCKTAHGVEYTGMIKVLETDGKIISNGHDKSLKIDMSGNENLHNYVKVIGATKVTLLINVEDRNYSFEENQKIIDTVTDSYEILKQKHIDVFSSIFNKVRLDISGNEENVSNEQLFLNSYNGEVDKRLIEKMCDFGRYLLISSSINCSFPANLQGLWNGDYSPAWACTFFNNENIEMNYWQSLMGNLSESLIPLFDLYDSLKGDYRENAFKLYGCRGILLPLFMDNKSGKKDNLQPHVLYWTGSSAWVSAIYYDYYRYTLDTVFLKDRAYPFMKESALFYEDFFVEDENGYLKSYPSNSPENRPDGDFEGAKELSVCINPTMDFALLKQLLKNCISAAEKLNVDKDKISKWNDMLSKIPPYQINEDGALREWMHDDFKENYKHRHLSHIFPLFPCGEITETNNKKIFDSIVVAINKRLVIGIKEQTGWSFAHMANIFCHLHQGEKALECLENLLRFCTGKNLYTHHNDWRNMGVTLKYTCCKKAPFQIDANMGFVSSIYEMFVQSNDELIEIFPAVPKSFKTGSLSGIKTVGDCEVSLTWNENSVDILIKNPNKCNKSVIVNGYLNEPIVLDFSNEKEIKLHYVK